MQDLDHRLSELMRAAQDGDRLAYETLLTEVAATVREFVRKRLPDVESQSWITTAAAAIAAEVVRFELHRLARIGPRSPRRAFEVVRGPRGCRRCRALLSAVQILVGDAQPPRPPPGAQVTTSAATAISVEVVWFELHRLATGRLMSPVTSSSRPPRPAFTRGGGADSWPAGALGTKVAASARQRRGTAGARASW